MAKLASAPITTLGAPEAPAEPQKPQTIAQALLAAQKAVGAVAKASQNEYDRYAYTSADTMVLACREALLSNGLVLSRDGHAFSDESPFDVPDLISHFLLELAETGESRQYEFKWPIVGNPKRLHAVDKAVAGALTTSLGYFERDLLNVPRSDPNEMDRREDHDAEQPQAKPTDLSRSLQADIAAAIGLLRDKEMVKNANVYLTRAGNDPKLLGQMKGWIARKVAEQAPADAAKAEAAPADPRVEPVDLETGELLEEPIGPEDPRFGLDDRDDDGP